MQAKHLTLSLFNDSCSDDPLTECDGMWRMELDRDTFITESYPNYIDCLTIGMRRKLQVGTAFPLYSSNLGYSISRDFDGDLDDVKGFLVYDDPKHMGAKTRNDRYKDAEADIKLWQDWHEGNVYGYRFDSDDEDFNLDDFSCSGYYGTDNFVEVIHEQLHGLINTLPVCRVVEVTEDTAEQTEEDTLYITLEGEAKWIFEYSFLLDTKVIGGKWVTSDTWEKY